MDYGDGIEIMDSEWMTDDQLSQELPRKELINPVSGTLFKEPGFNFGENVEITVSQDNSLRQAVHLILGVSVASGRKILSETPKCAKRVLYVGTESKGLERQIHTLMERSGFDKPLMMQTLKNMLLFEIEPRLIFRIAHGGFHPTPAYSLLRTRVIEHQPRFLIVDKPGVEFSDPSFKEYFQEGIHLLSDDVDGGMVTAFI